MNLHEAIANENIAYGKGLAWSKNKTVQVKQSAIIFDKQKLFSQLFGDMDLVKKLLKTFLKETPLLMDALDAAVKIGNKEASRAMAHKIAGVAGSVNAFALWDAARQMEKTATDQDAASLRLLRDEVFLQFDLLKRVLDWWDIIEIR